MACDVYTWCAVLLATPFRMPLFLFIAVLSQQNIQEPTHTNTERKRKAHKATHLTQGQCILAIHFDSIWIFISLQFSSNQCRLCCNTDREKDHESCKSRCKGMKYLHAGLFCFFSGVFFFCFVPSLLHCNRMRMAKFCRFLLIIRRQPNASTSKLTMP